jgi:phage gpG-like protein
VVRVVRIQTNDGEEVVARARRILDDPKPLLKQIGAIFTAQAQKAFTSQTAPDGEKWEGRYPNQDDPVVNFAGVVSDLAGGGGEIKGRRFTRRPALRDTGALFNSLRDERKAITEKGSFVVEVGSRLPYAARAQHGGISVLRITEEVREGIRKFIRSERGQPFFLRLVGFTHPSAELLETEVVPRPYFGLTDEAKERVVDLIENGVGDALGPAEG